MKKVLLLFASIVMIIGIFSSKMPFLSHGLANGVSTAAGKFRSENYPNRNLVAYKILSVTHGNPYLLPSSVIPSDNEHIKELANEITEGKSTDIEKSKAIFEWVANNLSYDTSKVNSIFTFTPRYQSVEEILATKRTICMGYARMNATLHRAIGIEARIVYSDDHAWNEIKLKGEWQDEDPTYASGYLRTGTNEFVHYYQEKYFTQTNETKIGEFEY